MTKVEISRSVQPSCLRNMMARPAPKILPCKSSPGWFTKRRQICVLSRPYAVRKSCHAWIGVARSCGVLNTRRLTCCAVAASLCRSSKVFCDELLLFGEGGADSQHVVNNLRAKHTHQHTAMGCTTMPSMVHVCSCVCCTAIGSWQAIWSSTRLRACSQLAYLLFDGQGLP